MTHICVSKLTIIGSDNGLSPGRRQDIIWTNAGILLIRTLGTDFSEILSEICAFSFKKMLLKMSSATWRPFCLGLNELIAPVHSKVTLIDPESGWSKQDVCSTMIAGDRFIMSMSGRWLRIKDVRVKQGWLTSYTCFCNLQSNSKRHTYMFMCLRILELVIFDIKYNNKCKITITLSSHGCY